MKIKKPNAIIFDWNGTLVYNDKDNKIRLIPNTIKLIKKLNELGIVTSIVSNTCVNFLNKTIKRYQLNKYFLNVIGTKGEIVHKKPSKEVIEHALLGSNLENIDINTVWMVGNSVQDLHTAYNSKIRPVIFGYELLNIILEKEGLEKNKKVLYFRNHLEFLKKIEEISNENT